MKSTISKIFLFIVMVTFSALLLTPSAFGQSLPKVTIGIDQSSKPGDVAVTLQIVMLMTILSLAPSIIIMVTSFTRVSIVFSFLKQALGTGVPNQVINGLAIFMTIFIMAPVWKSIDENALQPYLDGRTSTKVAYLSALEPVRTFMFKQTREKDLSLFVKLANLEKPKDFSDIPTHVLIPAFVISEFRIAFQLGFLIYIPFLLLDMVVSTVLMSMGMMMLPPAMISIPFKLLLFVLVDGWYLIVGSIVQGFK